MNPSLRDSINELINRSQRILMVTHVAPDGDALGSILGLGWLLDAQGKELTLACEDTAPKALRSLPGSERLVQQSDGAYDLVISVDCSDRRRMGTVYVQELHELPLLNIDHHVTNSEFGTVNWVDPASVSTTQMVLTLAEAMNWPVTQQVAVCLLTGLVTDTRSFRTSNVDLPAMKAAIRLMEAGASLTEITGQVLDQRSLASVYLWGQAFERLQMEDGLLWTEVTRDMRRQQSQKEDISSGLASFLSGVREAKAILVFTERDNGIIDVSMRSAPGYDVAQPALSLGGGGHPRAAGCTLKSDLAQAQTAVLAELHRSLAEQAAEET